MDNGTLLPPESPNEMPAEDSNRVAAAIDVANNQGGDGAVSNMPDIITAPAVGSAPMAQMRVSVEVPPESGCR